MALEHSGRERRKPYGRSDRRRADKTNHTPPRACARSMAPSSPSQPPAPNWGRWGPAETHSCSLSCQPFLPRRLTLGGLGGGASGKCANNSWNSRRASRPWAMDAPAPAANARDSERCAVVFQIPNVERGEVAADSIMIGTRNDRNHPCLDGLAFRAHGPGGCQTTILPAPVVPDSFPSRAAHCGAAGPHEKTSKSKQQKQRNVVDRTQNRDRMRCVGCLFILSIGSWQN